MPEIKENLFSIDSIIIKHALINGIKIKKDKDWVPAEGVVCLFYINQLEKFVLSYGTMETNGFVFLEKYGKDWVLNNAKKTDEKER